MKITEQKIARMRLSCETVRQSILQMGTSMKAAAEKVAEASKEFEKLSKKHP